jgi:hypothetical protein
MLLQVFYLPSTLVAQIPTLELTALGRLGGSVGQGGLQLNSETQALSRLSSTVLDGATGTYLDKSVPYLSNGQTLESFTSAEASRPQWISIRAKNDSGLSNSRNFLLTKQSWTIASNNESDASPTEITSDHYYQDECPEAGRNYYRFQSDRDQTVRIETIAHQLDSRARLVLTAKESKDVTIASTVASIEREASLLLEIKANQSVQIVIHDHLYRGGPEYRYAMIVHPDNMPESSSVAPIQSALDRWRQITMEPKSDQHRQTRHPRTAMLRAPSVENSILHTESNVHANAIPSIEWPCVISGEFHANTDVDAFDLKCENETEIVAEVVSQRLGESTDCALALYRIDNQGTATENRSLVAENDDMPSVGNPEARFTTKDSLLRFRIAQSGNYRLEVRNQQRLDFSKHESFGNSRLHNRPSSKGTLPSYAIEIRTPKPGFTLATHWSSAVRDLEQARLSNGSIPQGGIAVLSVHATRFDGFDQPIQLNCEGLPHDIQGAQGWLAADQVFTHVCLWHQLATATPAQEQPDQVQPLDRIFAVHLVGTSGELKSEAKPMEMIWPSIDTFRATTSRLTDAILMHVSAERVCPLTIELGPANVSGEGNSVAQPIWMEAVRGTSFKVPLRVTRRTGGESAPILFRLYQSPSKVTTVETKIEPTSNEHMIDLQIPKDAPLGEGMVSGLCETTISFPNPDPTANDKTLSRVIQLPTTSIRIRIGDSP